ncbi:MAG: type II toxin-antitoxin system RelE/ParE family toxin [Paludibacteraceae bacterium]|nr:type II toxin-antitoxin system RelE/ParE family toxin [Paludibacteraceae bacterium]MBR4563348.1 type II toxin-antitoxin system RelE/ParE family toxin [Paludibacteraceae bacterium]
MKIAWSPMARLKYSAVLLDVRDKDGYLSAHKLNKEVKGILKRIKKFPNSAQEEPMLERSNYTFRSVPFGSCNKLVYHVDGIYISIDNIWDTRREPKNQANETNHK